MRKPSKLKKATAHVPGGLLGDPSIVYDTAAAASFSCPQTFLPPNPIEIDATRYLLAVVPFALPLRLELARGLWLMDEGTDFLVEGVEDWEGEGKGWAATRRGLGLRAILSCGDEIQFTPGLEP